MVLPVTVPVKWLPLEINVHLDRVAASSKTLAPPPGVSAMKPSPPVVSTVPAIVPDSVSQPSVCWSAKPPANSAPVWVDTRCVTGQEIV